VPDVRSLIAKYLPLGVVWIVWGSTYLAIAVAVRNGFGAFSLGAIRLSLAGLLLLSFAVLRGQRVLLPVRDLLLLAAFGTLLWLCGNGLVSWAITRVDSGYAALVLATNPLWVAGIESVLDRRRPSGPVVFALLLGFTGIIVLSVPRIGGGGADVLGMVLLLVAAASWASGFVFQRRKSPELAPMVSAGYQLLFGAIGLAVVAALRGEPMPSPSDEALIAVAYLIVFGSIIGFGCYIVALRSLPSTVVTTHAYVNPVVAILLGWVVLSEPLDVATWAGTALVLAAVAIVFRARERA
jgi:drug/metabolite transporter (DMT)-like permease